MNSLRRPFTWASSRLFAHNSARVCGRSYPRYASRIKVPTEPTWTAIRPEDLTEESRVDSDLIALLERLALVDFNNQAGIDRLHKAIRYVDGLQVVDTTGVEPMDTVLEDRALYLRADVVTEGNCRHDIMTNAAQTEDDYFVAPPGNIPLAKDKSSRNCDVDS